MDIILAMLDTLQNTLGLIEVKGFDNIDRMLGSMRAVNDIKSLLLAHISSEQEETTSETEESNTEGVDEENGRPGDIGTDSGNGRKRGR